MIIQDLIVLVSKLPGIGKKTASRMVYDILYKGEEYAKNLGQILSNLHSSIRKCKNCYNFAEEEFCDICMDLSRNKNVICVVEMPQDLEVIESTGEYDGFYFVLHGHLDPLKDIGPNRLNLDKLEGYVGALEAQEVIIATEFSIEGDVTANYISSILKNLDINVTRIASGLPVGGSISNADKMTTLRALRLRFNM
ncbi:recombination mediator RecR [Borrelia hermsii]|uniref:Recombination protein RecR n=3 Tax=Borrelia hermsii TaxID=140 RepID=A0AAN0X5Q1_BORHE|nr:recombination mediator RecR [Borrelia hermsii]AAX16971.1 recombination protein RecR [Borrelia hermsii DAH]AHH12485.1 Recombination protein recR [Borrelia hermsii YBT]AJW73264.1 recombinase RecR [Borrelia hermsii CC1]AMR75382.1 recombination protein RecR (RecF pathway) [Borrelia hermsii]ANA43269.1 recombination protein RecR [Borrelia hermsii HS1]